MCISSEIRARHKRGMKVSAGGQRCFVGKFPSILASGFWDGGNINGEVVQNVRRKDLQLEEL